MRTFAETTTRGMHSLTNHSRNFTFQTAHSHKTRLRTLAAGFARGLACWFCPLQSEGTGNAGRPMRPIAACAGIVVERTRVSQVTPENVRHSPRNGLRLTSCSSRRSGFFVTVTSRTPPRSLTPASRRQNHTTSPSASHAVRQTARPRPPHLTATFVTIASRPLIRVRCPR